MRKRHCQAGTALAPWLDVSEAPTHSLYHEPTVMWRMQRADGLLSHAVIGSRANGTFVFIWFINDRPLGYRDCDDCASALRWSEQMLAQNWAVGWRLAPDYDDVQE